jgi:hypothetical protein
MGIEDAGVVGGRLWAEHVCLDGVFCWVVIPLS